MKLDKKLFKTLCQIQTVTYDMDDMKYFLFEYLTKREMEFDTDAEGNIYINRSLSNVPCMVAHLDTVHALTEDLTVFESNGIWIGINRETMQQTGIGGDDKVGIYITLELLKSHKMKAAFFVDEEIGCAGSYRADMSFFKDCHYVLQCDRRGNKDFVTNISGSLSSKAFQLDVHPVLKAYGYKFSDGMITDVGQLAENKIGISVANMSCGYYNPHFKDEYIVLEDVQTCMSMCNDILLTLTKRYNHTFKQKYNLAKWDSWDLRPYKSKTASRLIGEWKL